jgi:hypothetical protein
MSKLDEWIENNTAMTTLIVAVSGVVTGILVF